MKDPVVSRIWNEEQRESTVKYGQLIASIESLLLDDLTKANEEEPRVTSDRD